MGARGGAGADWLRAGDRLRPARHPDNAVFVSGDGKASFDEFGRKLDSNGNVVWGDRQSLRGANARLNPEFERRILAAAQAEAAQPQPQPPVAARRGAYSTTAAPAPAAPQPPPGAAPMSPPTAPRPADHYTTFLDQARNAGQLTALQQQYNNWLPPTAPGAPGAPDAPAVQPQPPALQPGANDYATYLDSLRYRWQPQ